VVKHFAKRCQHYITLNEPQCIVHLGHRTLEHAPGIYLEEGRAVLMLHHLLLAHGRAVRTIRQYNPEASVGIATTSTVPIPVEKTVTNIEAARQCYFSLERGRFDQVTLYSDPIFLGHYPTEFLEYYQTYLPHNYQKDLEIISQEIDFCYQNYYTGYFVSVDNNHQVKILPHQKENFTGVFDWLHYVPETLYYGPKFLYERYHKPVIISENGIAVRDELTNDYQIHDQGRIQYLAGYLEALFRIKAEGVPIAGYFAWSLFDNFEWAWGYEPRFGFVYIDYENQKRYCKDSFAFYRDFIKKH